jgi:hypothetical protein
VVGREREYHLVRYRVRAAIGRAAVSQLSAIRTHDIVNFRLANQTGPEPFAIGLNVTAQIVPMKPPDDVIAS